MNVDTFDFNMQTYVCLHLVMMHAYFMIYVYNIAIIGSEKGGAMGLQPRRVLHRIL